MLRVSPSKTQRTSFIRGCPFKVARSIFQVPCKRWWSSAVLVAAGSDELGPLARTVLLLLQPTDISKPASRRIVVTLFIACSSICLRIPDVLGHSCLPRFFLHGFELLLLIGNLQRTLLLQ